MTLQHFVPYFRHNFALTDCVTRPTEVGDLLPLVSVSYGFSKPLLDYFPMGQPSPSQIVHGARIRTSPNQYCITSSLLTRFRARSFPASGCASGLIQSRTNFTVKFSMNSLSTDCYKYTTGLLLSQALFLHLLASTSL